MSKGMAARQVGACAALALLLGACSQPAPDAGVARPGVGTAAGAVGGLALGRALAGSHNNTVAMLAGAALGGLAGNMLMDRPADIRGQQQQEAAKDVEVQRKLDYERQSTLQKAEVEKQIQEQALYEQWKTERAAGVTPAAVTGGNTLEAQRLLTALGYYRGPMDGVMGAQTRSAVMQFEGSQGLPETGVVTPSLVSRMRASL